MATRNLWLAVWRVADPKITLASAASLLIAAAAAWHDGGLSGVWLLLTVFGIFCIEAAKNASGDVVDFASGADTALTESERSPFSGGKRILVDGLVSRAQAMAIAAVFYAAGSAAGLAIVIWREPRVIVWGVVGVALAFFYHAPPLKLSYRGLGELAVAVTYGPLISTGAYLVQLHSVAPHVVAVSVPLALLIGAFLWINEFPDARADALAGKRTWVVRLGRPRAARVHALVVAIAYLLLVLTPLAGAPSWVLMGLAGAPLSLKAARRLLAEPEHTARIIKAQAWTLFAFVAYAVGVSAGYVVHTAVG